MNAWRAMLEDMYAWCLLKKGTLRNNIMLMSSHLENCLFIFVQPIVCKITSGLTWNWCACYNAICFSVVVVRLLCYLDWILMLRVPKWIFFLTNGDRVLAGSERWCGVVLFGFDMFLSIERLTGTIISNPFGTLPEKFHVYFADSRSCKDTHC